MKYLKTDYIYKSYLYSLEYNKGFNRLLGKLLIYHNRYNSEEMYTGSIGDNGGIFFELTDLIDKDETLKLRGYEFNIDYYNTFTSASKHYNIEHKIHNSYLEFNESDKNKFKYLVQDRILHFELYF